MTDDDKPIELLCRDLLSSRGEVSGMSLVQLVLDRYADFDDDQKLALFTLLAKEMDVSCGDAVVALQTYERAPTAANYAALTKLVEPTRLQLIRRLNQTQYATTQLVAMRHDLLRLLDKQPELAKLDIDFKKSLPHGSTADFWFCGQLIGAAQPIFLKKLLWRVCSCHSELG